MTNVTPDIRRCGSCSFARYLSYNSSDGGYLIYDSGSDVYDTVGARHQYPAARRVCRQATSIVSSKNAIPG